LTNKLKFRLAAVVLLAVAPSAVLLAVLVAEGALSPVWPALVLTISVAGAAAVSVAAYRRIDRSVQRVAATAAAMAARRAPIHFPTVDRDPAGQVERMLTDVADSLIAELRALNERADEFEAILRGMTEAVVVTDSSGQVVLLNGAARHVFALPSDGDFRNRPFVELCRDPRLQEFVTRAMSSVDGAVMSSEFLIQNPAPRHLSVNAAPVRPARHGAAAWVFVFHDITQLKAYETARADFIANLTHELRTPLSALCGYAETLLSGVDDESTRRRFLSIIERQSRRLARLIEDLITLSDLERGFTPLKIEPLDCGRVVSEAVELMRETAARRGVTLKSTCADTLPVVPADHDRIHQVLINLIDNAVKYTPRGGSVSVEVRQSALREGTRADGVALVVSDTGEGIPAADIPRLTERFYRVDRARSRELGGTGLGLAIVKHIVQLHHGLLKIESRLREGTTVTVWLPGAEDATPAESAPAPSRESQG
jgi:two-component system phosphate regulon sensor histidine kinase PhoR